MGKCMENLVEWTSTLLNGEFVIAHILLKLALQFFFKEPEVCTVSIHIFSRCPLNNPALDNLIGQAINQKGTKKNKGDQEQEWFTYF